MNYRIDDKDLGRITATYRPEQVEQQPPCQAGCPNCGDIRGWIGVVAQRRKIGIPRDEAYARAWRMITDVNPFPSVLGRVCPHPCEAHCNRSEYDEPLAINAMERFLGDWGIAQGLTLQSPVEDSGAGWIGVVGAGPSGLSFAYQMARRGYRVTVYEGRKKAGGMLRYGVPDYRLPQEVLEAEINRILDLGVELHLGTEIGTDVSLAELRDRHTALYLGLGAQHGRRLGLPGEDGPSVWTGTDYLARVSCGEEIDLGLRVVVIGGGNSAVDAARTARRTGAAVTILYRRSRSEMPAIEAEIEDALEEGIELHLLTAPVRVSRAADGKLRGIFARRTELGEPGRSGRRRPVEVPGTETEFAADSMIVAVSQSPVLAGFEALDHEGSWLVADADGVVSTDVMAGGDALGLGIAGAAIAQGRFAAEKLHERLAGSAAGRADSDGRPPAGAGRLDLGLKPTSEAARAPKLGAEERIQSTAAEVAGTISEMRFLQEVERCYSCGSCMGCEQCAMYCTAGCFTRVEEVRPGMYYTLTLDNCQECGKCIEVCPCGFLDVS